MMCKDLGLKTVPWQSTLTTNYSLNHLKEIEYRMAQEKWDNCGIIMPHLETEDIQKNRKKVVDFLNNNIGKQEQLVSIRDIANHLQLTEEFILNILKEFGMDIVEE